MMVGRHASCVSFPKPSRVQDQLQDLVASLLFLKRVEVGCHQQPIPMNHHKRWQEAGSCRLEQGILIDPATPDQIGNLSKSDLAPERLVVQLEYDADHERLTLPDAQSVWKLGFVQRAARANHGERVLESPLRLAMVGGGAWRELVTGLAA